MLKVFSDELAFFQHDLSVLLYKTESDAVNISKDAVNVSKYQNQRELIFFTYLLKLP